MNETVPSAETRRQAAVDRLATQAKQYAVKTGKGLLSSVTGGLADADGIVSDVGDALGGADGKNPIKGIWDAIMSFIQPLIDWVKGLFGMIDHDATLAEKAVPDKITKSTAYKDMASKLSLKQEVGSDIQKIAAESAKAFLKDGIPEFDADGTQTSTINHVIATHEEIVAYLAGEKGKTVGRLAQQYPDMSPAQREQEAERIASYVTGLPPEPAEGYDLAQLVRKNANGSYANISGGLAQTLLDTQAKAKGPNHPKDSLKENDIPLDFNNAALAAAVAGLTLPASSATPPSSPPATPPQNKNPAPGARK